MPGGMDVMALEVNSSAGMRRRRMLCLAEWKIYKLAEAGKYTRSESCDGVVIERLFVET